MRNGQNKRMRGRNRKGGGGHHHQNPLSRMYESNGPDIKIRGTASHVAEKYLQLARDAQSSGDPVAAENYYQHAEHYFRLIAAAQEQFRQSQPYFQQGGDQRGNVGDDGYDDGDEQPSAGEPFAPRDQQPFYPREQQHQQNQPQQFQPRHAARFRRTRKTSNGCRHSSRAAAASHINNSRSNPHRSRVKATTAATVLTARMVRTATTVRRTASRCIGGAGGIAARATTRCRAKVMVRRGRGHPTINGLRGRCKARPEAVVTSA